MKCSLFGFALLALSLVVAADSVGREKGKPRAQTITGAVTKVDGISLTVTQRGDGGDRSTVFAMGAQTKILLQTKEDDVVKGEGGQERKVPKTKEGKIADVKADQRVTVRFVEPGKADSILVLRPGAPAKEEGR